MYVGGCIYIIGYVHKRNAIATLAWSKYNSPHKIHWNNMYNVLITQKRNSHCSPMFVMLNSPM